MRSALGKHGSWLLLLGLLAWPATAGGDVVLSAGYRAGEIAVTAFEGYDLVELRDLPVIGELEGFAFPVEALPFELPDGEVVTGIDVLALEQEILDGTFRLPPADLYLMNRPPEGPDRSGSLDPVPSSPARLGSVGNFQGLRLGSVLVYPFQYIPGTGEILLNREIRVLVRTERSTDEPDPIRPRASGTGPGDAASALDMAWGKGTGESAFGLGAETEFRHLDEDFAEYVIITTDGMAEEFQRLADWRTARGMPARVVKVSWIESTYPVGVDVQERIRSFLQDAYRNWGTRWVLLGGDSEAVPTRVCLFTENPFRTYEWGRVVCDLYYACLDGTWDGDGDGIFGEYFYSPGLDLYPELFLGRAPVNTPEEARVFVDKVFRYRRTPALDYQETGLFMAQQIVPAACPGYHGERFIEPCVRWLPEDFEIKRLYQCASSFPDRVVEELNLHRAFQAIDDGYAVVGQVGHGDEFKMDCASGYFRRVHADSVGNRDRLSLFVLLNCSTSNLDVDCLAERLVRSDRGGAIAFIGNSAYAFPPTGGPYMAYLFKLLYSCGVTNLGELCSYFRVPFVPLVQRSENNRWTQYSYLLLGDPALDVWIDTPKSLVISHAGTMTLADSTYGVTVESGGAPVPGIVVCLWMRETGAYARGVTGSDGAVELPFLPRVPGEAGLVAIGTGYLPVEDSVAVSGSGRVGVAGVSVEDASGGNGNGRFEAGETVSLLVALENGGASAVSGLDATLGLAPSAGLEFDVRFDGVPDPARVWIGASLWQPGAVPFRVEAGEGNVLGQSPSTLETRSGACVWLDAAGWHVRCRSGTDSLVVSGTVSADAGLVQAVPWRFEAGDLLEETGGVIQFTCVMDTCDLEDGFDVQCGDSAGVWVLSGSQSVGTIEAGSEEVAGFVLESDPRVPDRRPVWFVLDLDAGADSWSEWIRTEIVGPHLELLYARVDDSGGDGDGAPDPGETIALYPAVANWGGGEPGDMEVHLRAISGATMIDSLVPVISAAARNIREADGAFTFTAASMNPLFEVEFVAGSRTVGLDTLALGSLAAPDTLWHFPGPEQIRLGWSTGFPADARGYRVLRRDPGKAAFEFLAVTLQSGAYLDAGLASGRSYEYAVSAFDSSGTLSPLSDPLLAWTNPPALPGFPADACGESYGSPAAADLDRDGDLEIVVGTKDGRVSALHHDGSLVRGWPQLTKDEVWGSPALGDLDGDGDLEVVAGDRDGYLWVWNWDGSLYGPVNNPELDDGAPGWPRKAAGELRSAPTLSDLDQDGLPEILVSSLASAVYCWRYDGTGFKDTTGVFGVTESSVWASPSVADLDGDGDPEVVVGTWLSGGVARVYAWNADGTDYRATSPFAQASGMIWTAAAIGNLDSDPEMEIVLGTDGGILYAWNHDGSGLLDGSGVFARLRDNHQKFRSSPALGDLDGDGDLEIVIGSDWANSVWDTVYAWNHDGTGAIPGGSRVVGVVHEVFDSMPSSPTLADVDGDGETDILIGAEDGRVWAWDRDGRVLDGWPVETRLGCYASPGVADLDRDGDLEVFITAYDARAHVWDVSGDPASAEWGTYQQGPWHTGSYGFSPPADTTAPILAIGVLQNPVLERSLDLYLSSTENLPGSTFLSVQVGTAFPETLQAVHLTAGLRDLHLFHAGFWAGESQTGLGEVTGWGADVSGNRGGASLSFTFKRVVAVEGGSVHAADGRASLTLPPRALAADTYLLVAPCDGRSVSRAWAGSAAVGGAVKDPGPAYAMGPPGRLLSGEATVLLRLPPGRSFPEGLPGVCRLEGNRWVSLPRADAPEGWVGGRTDRLGIFMLKVIETPQEIIETEITGSYPNPFNPQTTIRFALSASGRAVLSIFDVQGRRVVTLIDAEMPAGVHQARWDGRNCEGHSVASGIYFCRLDAGGKSAVAKLVLLK